VSDIPFEETNRGFLRGEFKDRNGVSCSLQESSIVDEEGCIWLGCNDIGLKKFEPGKGWSDVELQNDPPYGICHQANTRMHLTQTMVAELLPALAYFAAHGTLPKFERTASGEDL
jgi:hypothetical protein